MRVRTETITPERAADWLARSEDLNQRTIRRTRVERLVHAIESGQWVLTHQPIALDPDGRVLDGQHRLTAIVRAGIPVEALIAWDSDPATFGVIDTGVQRTQADALKIAGYHNTNVLAATVRAVLAYDMVAGTTNGFAHAAKQLTTADTLDWLDTGRNRDAALSATNLGNRLAVALGRYGLKSAISAVPLIFRTHPSDVGPDALAEFFERLSDGAMLAPYSPILALRRFFVNETGYARIDGTLKRPVTLAVTIKAINDYALGNERTNAVWRPGVEPMPLPVAPGTREAASRAHEAALAAEEAAEEAREQAPASQRGKRPRAAAATNGTTPRARGKVTA
jgi:hypothetical protein